MDHSWQTTSSRGVELLNSTLEGPFALYPSNHVSYYIGVIYTEPQNLPSYVQQDLNALGEYITFSFYITLWYNEGIFKECMDADTFFKNLT